MDYQINKGKYFSNLNHLKENKNKMIKESRELKPFEQ